MEISFGGRESGKTALVRAVKEQHLHDCEHYNNRFSEWLIMFSDIMEKRGAGAEEILSELRYYSDVLAQESAIFATQKLLI